MSANITESAGNVPLANGNGYHQVSRPTVHHTGEVGFLITVLVDVALEVDVGLVDVDVDVVLAGVIPVP